MNSIVMPGRRIGNNCIVGAGAVVTSDIPDNSVCAGNPAKVIMTIEQFNQKRNKRYLDDAKRNVQHFNLVHKRFPSTEELHGFSLLFLERTEENWDRYFSSYLTRDNNIDDLMAAFFKSKPQFDSYDSFIKFCLKE